MTSTVRIVGWLVFVAAAGGCSAPPTHGRGGPCHSLTDCKPGFVCDQGKCTNDLSRLAGQTDDPPFTRLLDAGPEVAADTGVQNDAATANDASASSDAGSVATDAGSAASADASASDGG